MTKKNISFKLDEDLHREIKIKATLQGKNLKEYLLDLAKEDLREEKTGKMEKKIFEQWEISKFLEPFDGEKVTAKITTLDLIIIELKNAVIKADEDSFSFKGKDFIVPVILYKKIKYLGINEENEVASVNAYLRDGTIVNFTYKNI